MKRVLAVDGGNSKTLAAVMDEAGNLLSIVLDSGCNYQGIGRKASEAVIGRVVELSLGRALVERADFACFGISGADRDKDFAVIQSMIDRIGRWDGSVLVNDTILALRAATEDGVGVALIGGAGSNCIGMDAAGRIRKAGGLGPLTGDKANAGALVLDAVVASMKGIDGRGPETTLVEKFKTALNLSRLEDVIEFEFFDSRRFFDFGALAPLIFEAAAEGDGVAAGLLADHGREAGQAALAVLRDLFSPADSPALALGGSVLQKGEHPALVDAVKETVAAEFPGVRFTVLDDHPLLGGLLRAFDELGMRPDAAMTGKIKNELDKGLAAL